MLVLFLTISLLLIPAAPAAYAEPYPEDTMLILLSGNVEQVIKDIEASEDLNWDPQKGLTKLKLWEENTEYYTIALMASGYVDKAEKFIQEALKKYKKNKELNYAQRQIALYQHDYESEIGLNKELEQNLSKMEKVNIELLKLFPEYLGSLDKKQEKKIEELIGKLDNRSPYFPSKLDYMLELAVASGNKKLEQEYHSKVRSEAKQIISDSTKKLFPKTMDFYELMIAHRALSILSFRDAKPSLAEKHYRLALVAMSKMRSIWLIEDIFVGTVFRKRHTKFGYVLPQWIMSLRTKLMEEYELLLREQKPLEEASPKNRDPQPSL